VFSTLHTNDAASALTRLSDLGVKPFLVSASMQAVIAQRLVRRLCKECAVEYTATEAEFAVLKLDPRLAAQKKLKRAKGCRTCEGSGYRGRIALFELLEMEASVREMCFEGASLDVIRQTAESAGCLRTLLTDGARKVLRGETSTAEVLRVTRLGAEFQL
jgi:type II secretory ATPase GspE/PulE/Tfp pilus assembly ATPase PilB-like protein